MKKLLLALALAACAGNALAIDLTKPYFGVLASTFNPDEDRPNIRPWGTQLLVGIPLNQTLSLEPNAYVYYMPRKPDDTADLTYGGGVDLVIRKMDRNNLMGFFIAGGGISYEDVSHVEGLGGYVNAGVGLAKELSFLPRWSLRGEVRAVYEFNDVASEFRSDTVLDYRVSFGVQRGFLDTYTEPAAPPAADSDGDGVLDSADLCPGTPPGTAVDANGCPAAPSDADGDGVSDTLDQCPGTPPGTRVDANGCELVEAGNPDLDGDGVANGADQCPDTPAGFKVDAVGCLIEQTLALQSVNFEFGSDDLTADAKGILDGIAAGLAAQTAVKVQVVGHTDALGPQNFNLSLSQKRAKSVISYLTSKGVDAARLKSDGEGEFNPIASNDTEAGRAANRRVEFKIVTQ